MTTYGFSCVDCGRCCVHAPRLTIDEAFRFADTFLTFPVLYSAFFPKSQGKAIAHIQADKKAGFIHIIPVTGGTEDGFLTIGICLQAYRDLADDMCPMLNEKAGKCRLTAEERPLYCQAKPLSPFILPQHYEDYTPDQTYSYCVHEPPREGDDIFYQDGKIFSDSTLAKKQEQGRKAIAYDFRAMHLLLSAILQGAFPKTILSVPVLYQRCMEEGSFQVPLPIDLVFTTNTMHPLTRDKRALQNFYQQQIALLRRITEEKWGNHQDQKTMKTLLTHHQNVLASLMKGRD